MQQPAQAARQNAPETLLRLPEVLSAYPVSKSKWYAGIKSGIYPASVSLGPRAKAWRSTDIAALIASAK